MTGITPEARALLVRYGWPGNVRELRNAIENMVLLARGDSLTVDLSEHGPQFLFLKDKPSGRMSSWMGCRQEFETFRPSN